MIIALTGQPNCGKSTLFNALAGYKATTANLPGASVSYLSSEVLIGEEKIGILDLPGTYSLTSTDLAERETRRMLLAGGIDVVVNVVDASMLSRSLELTLQLLEMGLPMLVVLNMMDDARRKGIAIDIPALSERLGVPVVGMTVTSGEGMDAFLEAISVQLREKRVGRMPRYADDVEEVIGAVTCRVDPAAFDPPGMEARFLAIRLIEGDVDFTPPLARLPALSAEVEKGQETLSRGHGREAYQVVSSERHALAMDLFEEVGTVGTPGPTRLTNRLDAVLMHHVWGFFALAAIFYAVFWIVFSFGKLLEYPILGFFESLSPAIHALPLPPLVISMVSGIAKGMAGGLAIVVPFLAPFFILLAILEDTGYIPRMAFLTDSLMHKLGLHGKSAFPLVIGYGCSVPAVMSARILESPRDRFITSTLAVMSARILESPRDRFITSTLAVMVPCSARVSIIFGLVAAFISPSLALIVFLLNLVILAIVGRVLSAMLPGDAPGMIMEIPPYRLPKPKILLVKTWLRLKDFVVFAWPILIGGSVVFALMEYVGLGETIDMLFRPITWSLGLPAALGVPLVFGILRKELSMLMLFQALGTTDIGSMMTPLQILTFTVFTIFYLPCLSTLTALLKEQGWVDTLKIVVVTTAVALIVALATRWVAAPLL